MKRLFIVILLLSWSVPVQAFDCFRCQYDRMVYLICKGASTGDILSQCGQPEEKKLVKYIKVKKPFKRESGQEGYDVVKERIEKWRYNCGDGMLNMELLIESNKLVSVDNLSERGTGQRVCW